MSLDVTLYRNYHISYDEGKTLEPKKEEVYSSNITHNLNRMADEAGLYEALWRPYMLKTEIDFGDDYSAEYKFEEENPSKAHELIAVIEKGLADLKAKPKHYEKFNSSNGWGMYEHFVPFVENYLNALKEFPDADVEVSR